jgi:hypothetical protein
MTPIKRATRGAAAKPETCFLTSAAGQRASASGFAYPTVESALRTADAILGNRAESVWIVDREGNLILPADQARAPASPSRRARGAL